MIPGEPASSEAIRSPLVMTVSWLQPPRALRCRATASAVVLASKAMLSPSRTRAAASGADRVLLRPAGAARGRRTRAPDGCAPATIAPPCARTRRPGRLEGDEVLADRHRRDAEPRGEVADAGAAVLLDDARDPVLALAGEDVPVVVVRRHAPASPSGRSGVGTFRNRASAHLRANENVMSRSKLKSIETCVTLSSGGRTPVTTRHPGGHRSPVPSGPRADGRATSSGGSARLGRPESVVRTPYHRPGRDGPRAPPRRRRAPDRDDAIGHRRGPDRPADRAAVVGVRQLRDAVQGVRPAGRAARPVREDRRRRAGPPLHRRRPDGRAPHPVGQGRRLRGPGRPRPACGVALGTINSNTFQDDDYMLGSVCHPDARVRRKAVAHLLECVDIMDATGSRDLKLWFADGTNYPGQDDIRARQDRLAEALATVYERLGAGPADGPRVQVLRAVVLHDRRPRLGHRVRPLPRARRQGAGRPRHRPPRAGHEHRVHRRASCCALGKLGAFDFNSRFYADDDLMVGAADPFQLFRIMHEVVERPRAGARGRASRSCSTSATTSSRRSPARSAR